MITKEEMEKFENEQYFLRNTKFECSCGWIGYGDKLEIAESGLVCPECYFGCSLESLVDDFSPDGEDW